MENSTKNKQGFYPTIFQGFGIILIFIFLSFLMGMLMLAGNFPPNDTITDILELLGYALAAGGTLLLVVNIKTRVYRQKPVFRNFKVTPADYVIALLITILIIIVVDPLTSLIPMPEQYRSLFESMFSKTLPAFLTAVVVAPLLEELIFRGVILEGFLKNYSPVKAIIWTNLLFGLAHLNPWQFLGAFLVGIFISWVYYKTRNLALPIFIHFINNLTSYLFLYLTDKPIMEASLKDLFTGSMGYYTLVVICLVLLALFFSFSHRLFPVSQPRGRNQ